jgi:hypothetical protein
MQGGIPETARNSLKSGDQCAFLTGRMRGRAVLSCLATLAVAVAAKKVVKKTKDVSLVGETNK